MEVVQYFCRCHNHDKCKAYQHSNREPGNCILIQEICGNATGRIFQNNDDNVIYEKGLPLKCYMSNVFHNSNYKNKFSQKGAAIPWFIYHSDWSVQNKMFENIQVLKHRHDHSITYVRNCQLNAEGNYTIHSPSRNGYIGFRRFLVHFNVQWQIVIYDESDFSYNIWS